MHIILWGSWEAQNQNEHQIWTRKMFNSIHFFEGVVEQSRLLPEINNE
mgnify:CR=1 FL=1